MKGQINITIDEPAYRMIKEAAKKEDRAVANFCRIASTNLAIVVLKNHGYEVDEDGILRQS